jgi:hypothetical protein
VTAPSAFAIHDPDVVLTDLALAVLGAWLAWRLARVPGKATMARSGVVIMAALASAALWGAVFHAFFPAGTTTRPGFVAWMPVALSIVVIGTALLALALRVAAPRVSASTRRWIAGAYGIAFALTVLLVDESYRTIVCFYAPVVLLFLVVAARQALRTGDSGWTLIAVSFAVSLLAAAVQQSRIALHPEYFDHNALYHVLQGIALVLLYRGFLRAPARGGTRIE